MWKGFCQLEGTASRFLLQRSHTFEGVEGPAMPVKSPPPRWLQRSHTFEGVEGSALATLSTRIDARFNGATPLRVWKDNFPVKLKARTEALQRSHTFEGVEGTAPPATGSATRLASTEPHL